MFQVDEHSVEFSYNDAGLKSTHCWVFRIIDGKKFHVADGIAKCSKSDQFNKNTGRKVALSRTLQQLTTDRALRKRFWDEYFKVRHGKH